jgi:hypothetical protein
VDSGAWTARRIQGDLDLEGDSSPGGVSLRVGKGRERFLFKNSI